MFLKVIDLEYRYENLKVLSKLSLKLNRGDHILIHGPSGCGKTTLVNLMAGLLRPPAGSIFFENQDINSMSEEQLDNLRAKNFGFIFQRLHLIGHLNVEQNILISCFNQDFQKINNLINDLGLSGKNKKKVRDLSIGEAQRVAIARGVINNPKVIFADEPTSALDGTNAENVIDLLFLQTKKNNSTLIVSSHDDRIKNRFKEVKQLKL